MSGMKPNLIEFPDRTHLIEDHPGIKVVRDLFQNLDVRAIMEGRPRQGIDARAYLNPVNLGEPSHTRTDLDYLGLHYNGVVHFHGFEPAHLISVGYYEVTKYDEETLGATVHQLEYFALTDYDTAIRAFVQRALSSRPIKASNIGQEFNNLVTPKPLYAVK